MHQNAGPNTEISRGNFVANTSFEAVDCVHLHIDFISIDVDANCELVFRPSPGV